MNLPDAKAPEGSNTFLKIKDGESIRGVFIGDMFTFYTKWVSGKSVTTDNKDPDGKIRFRCNFVYHDAASDQLVVKIWEFPWGIFEKLKGINEEYPLEQTKVKISRSGTGMETEYQILPLVGPKDLMTKAQVDAINNMSLLSLEVKDKKPQGGSKEFDASDEIPF